MNQPPFMFSQQPGMMPPQPGMMPPQPGMMPPQPGPPPGAMGGMPPPQPPPGMGAPPGGPAAAMGGPPGAGQGMDPAFVQQMLGARGLQSRQADIGRQRKMADMLRASGDQGLKGTTVGKYTAAPGALQLAASLYGQYQGAQMDKGIDESQSKLVSDESDIAKGYFDKYMAGRQRK